MKKLIIFTAPTCGPCQLFKPQVKTAALNMNIAYEEIDVTTDDGLAKAKEFNINSSGIALYLIDNKEVIKFDKPCAAATIENMINEKS